MKILLGSTNPSKEESLKKALDFLGINEYEIVMFKAESKVSSKPIGIDIIIGAENRNADLKNYALENNIEYDYLCSIEGGFEITENDLPFVVTYCVTEDKTGKKSTGKSLGVRITKTMFDYISKGGSLNKIIETINEKENNKQEQGIMGYLTNGLYNRSDTDKDAIISSFISFIYKKEKDRLNEEISKLI